MSKEEFVWVYFKHGMGRIEKRAIVSRSNKSVRVRHQFGDAVECLRIATAYHEVCDSVEDAQNRHREHCRLLISNAKRNIDRATSAMQTGARIYDRTPKPEMQGPIQL